MLSRIRKWWTVKSSSVSVTYTDQHAARLGALRADLNEAMRSLAQEQAVWDKLKDRSDPESHQQRTVIAPRIIDLQAQVKRLSDGTAVTERAIEANKVLFAKYVPLIETAQAETEAVLHAFGDDARVKHFLLLSLEIDRLTNALLHGTGDRQFRRACVDPFNALRSAARDVLDACERERLMRSANSMHKKTAV